MLLVAIRSELARLQIHSANLRVTTEGDCDVGLQGSLLRYWNVPENVDGTWLLGVLQGLPDASGPESVMNALGAAWEKKGLPLQNSQQATAVTGLDSGGQNIAHSPSEDQFAPDGGIA